MELNLLKERGWPFQPLCLTEIISEDILTIIQTGISLKHNIPLFIIEFKDGKPREITPIVQPRMEFCQKFREITLRDGKTKPGDETCRICDSDTAGEFINRKKMKAEGYPCHLGIVKVVAPIVVANKHVAVFFGGQILYEDNKWAIVEHLKEWASGNPTFREGEEKCKAELCKRVDITRLPTEIHEETIGKLSDYISKMTPHIPEDFNQRKQWMENYITIISDMANTIHREFKKAEEEAFLHRIALIFTSLEPTELERMVSSTLKEINDFLRIPKSILFASDKEEETILPIVGKAGCDEIENVHLNIKKMKDESSGFKGDDARKMEGFTLIRDDEKKLKIALALGPSSSGSMKDIVRAERLFFNSLLQLLASAISNMLEEIKLLKQADELKEQDAELKNKYKNLQTATSDLAHEFKTALHPIRTDAGIWLSRCQKGTCSSLAENYYRNISNEIERLSNMVNMSLQSLETKTVPGPVKEYISLSSIILACIEGVRSIAKEKNIKIDVSDSIKKIPSTIIEKERIIQAIKNLLDNAVKYSFPDKIIKIYSRDTSDGISVIFTNFGIGIFPDEIERVFERGYRGRAAEKDSRSSGLGLSEAQKIIREQGGGDITIESYSGERGVYSKEGKGYVTKVTVTLPIIDALSIKKEE
ncbi:MAG: ATP-binding protein [bacterium]